jgi:hypothetical protein
VGLADATDLQQVGGDDIGRRGDRERPLPGASVDELDVDVDAVLGGGGAGHGADARRGAAPRPITRPSSPSATRTSRRTRSPERARLDDDGVGIVDDRRHHVGQHRTAVGADGSADTSVTSRP